MANILFVCSSNSVRSQMAEGWAKHFANDTHGVRSAGISPFRVHPVAVAAMNEVGIDISHQINRRLDNRQLSWADWVITLSDAVKPYTTYFPDTVRYDHWSIPNPDVLVNHHFSQADAYAKIRDKLKERIERFLQSLEE